MKGEKYRNIVISRSWWTVRVTDGDTQRYKRTVAITKYGETTEMNIEMITSWRGNGQQQLEMRPGRQSPTRAELILQTGIIIGHSQLTLNGSVDFSPTRVGPGIFFQDDG